MKKTLSEIILERSVLINSFIKQNQHIDGLATSCYPGFNVEAATRQIVNDFSLTKYIQLCPQNNTEIITTDLLKSIRMEYPTIQFRFHANPRITKNYLLVDLSSDFRTKKNKEYITTMRNMNDILGGSDYTIHAGDNKNIKQIEYRVNYLSDFFGCKVGVEGLYTGIRGYSLNSWSQYAELLIKTKINYAIDLSHINIIAKNESYNDFPLLAELLSSDRCIEVHISGNDGYCDRHEIYRSDDLYVNFYLDNMSRFNFKSILFLESRLI